MSLLDKLRERWQRGRSAMPAAEPDAAAERILTSPDAAAQLNDVPGGQKEQVLDGSAVESGSEPER